jgi:hypothetical protein
LHQPSLALRIYICPLPSVSYFSGNLLILGSFKSLSLTFDCDIHKIGSSGDREQTQLRTPSILGSRLV